MSFLTRNILSAALPLYDELLLIRSHVLSNITVQTLIALFFIGSLLIAIFLFVYWGSCACHLLSADGVQLTDADVEPMLWEKRLRAQLWSLFSGSVFTLT
jgi:hypothetical protein